MRGSILHPNGSTLNHERFYITPLWFYMEPFKVPYCTLMVLHKTMKGSILHPFGLRQGSIWNHTKVP